MDKRTPRAARFMLGIAAAALASGVIGNALGQGGSNLTKALLDGSIIAAGTVTLIAADARTGRFRLVWGTVGLAQLLYGLGEINLDFVQHGLNTFPTTSDFLWLAYYPLVLLGVAIYLADGRSLRPLLWVDGTIIVLVLVAASFALLLGSIIDAADAPATLVRGQVVYPVLDLCFVAFALVLGFAGRWRLGPAFYLAGGAALMLLVTDLVYFHQLAYDTYVAGTLLDAGWAATMLLMSMAALTTLRRPGQNQPAARSINVLSLIVIPLALALLIWGADHSSRIVTVFCAAAAILLVAIRLLNTSNEIQRLADDNEEIISSAGEGILRADVEGRITYANPAACTMLGVSSREILGRAGHELFHHSHENGSPYPAEACPIHNVGSSEHVVRVSDEVFWRRDGTSFPADYTAAAVRENGQASGVVVVFDDVTQQRSLEDRLRYQASHDHLSGLLNRRAFAEQVEEQVRYAQRYGVTGALLLVDLDSFKLINDSFGYAIGDNVVRQVSAVLRKRLRKTDVLARMGGDEFAVLLPEAGEEEAIHTGRELIRAIKSETEPSLGASVGLATFGGPEEVVADDLVVRADIALYQAKQQPGSAIAWNGQKTDRLTWVDTIRDAMRDDRLVVYSQPILSLRSNRIEGEELLVRLITPDGEVIPPRAFLPTAERYGLAQDIDRLVMNRALELARSGRRIAVNVSAHSIDDDVLISLLDEARVDGVDLGLVTVEITETAAVSHADEAHRFAERLQRMGCGLALDDFGTGLSSLSYLKQIPAQVLKIDTEFVRGVTGSSLDQYLVRTIVGIARRLGQVTIAEGVEDAATLATLRRFEVDFAQGYFIGRPAPVDFGHAPELSPELGKQIAATAASGC